MVGYLPANYIAKWNGTNWSTVDRGVNNAVYAMAANGTDVFVGGEFSTAGSVTADHIAKWNGTTWSSLGTGTDRSVTALAVSGSVVYAGGEFFDAGGAVGNRVAKWNGTSWSAMGNGLYNGVYALAVSGSDVYAGGRFVTTDGAPADHIAKWNGISWSSVGTGLNDAVFALATGNSGTMYAGGIFTTVGDGSKVTSFFGAYWPQGVPTATIDSKLIVQVKLYPNPAHTAVFVVLPAELRRTAHTAELVDALGRVVRTKEVLSSGNSLQVSLQSVTPGLYSLRIFTATGTFSKRLVVE